MQISPLKFLILGVLQGVRPLMARVDVAAFLHQQGLGLPSLVNVWLHGQVPVQYMTKTFVSALFEAYKRLDVRFSFFEQVLEKERTEIFLHGNQFVFVRVENQQLRFVLGHDAIVHGLCSFTPPNIAGFISPDVYKNDGINEMQWWTEFIVFLLFFLNNCDVQTKLLPPKSSVRIKLDNYTNQSQLPVKIINSTWFTTLINRHAHKVRGHFRLQPYGKGRTMYKLIWIDEFEKQGFVKPARVLKHNPEHPANSGTA